MSRYLLWLAPMVLLAACGGTAPEDSQPGQRESARLMAPAASDVPTSRHPITVAYQRSAYLVTASGDGNIVRLVDEPGDQGIFVPSNAIIRFSDTSLIPYSENGHFASAYRLYRAAFARTPDMGGLLYWVSALDSGASLDAIASAFVESLESRSIYGNNLTDPAIITGYYRNVLGRAPDAAGLSYWVNLQQGGTSLSQILLAFSESAENKASIGTQIAGGMAVKEEGVVYPGTIAPHSAVALVVSGNRSVGNALSIKPDTTVGANTIYTWSLMNKPAASKAQVNAVTSQLSFTPDVPGTYQIGLTMTGSGGKLSGSVSVTVTEQRLLNQPYLAKNGMTVTLESMVITDHGGSYTDYTVTYIQTNKTGLAIDEATLKLYFQKAEAMPQYGWFNKVYPGDSLTRSYTFTQLKSEAPTVLEYDADNFIRAAPAVDSLQWPIPLN